MTLLEFTEQKLVHLFMDSYIKISNHAGSLSMKLMIVDLSSATQKIWQICSFADLRFLDSIFRFIISIKRERYMVPKSICQLQNIPWGLSSYHLFIRHIFVSKCRPKV